MGRRADLLGESINATLDVWCDDFGCPFNASGSEDVGPPRRRTYGRPCPARSRGHDLASVQRYVPELGALNS